MFYLSGWLALTYIVLYEPNFSLMFSIHLFLNAGVYCIIIPKKRWINSNIKTLSLERWASTKQIQTCTYLFVAWCGQTFYIQNIKNVLLHCLFDRNLQIPPSPSPINAYHAGYLGKGINSAIPMMHCKQTLGRTVSKRCGFAVSGYIGFMWTETPYTVFTNGGHAGKNWSLVMKARRWRINKNCKRRLSENLQSV